jgi:nucleolar complex protein 3
LKGATNVINAFYFIPKCRFAHIINIEFFSDLIEVLNHLIEKADLGYREQLHCIQTVFAILSGQGEALNIDPSRFYTHLYRNILSVNAGKNHKDVESVIDSLENVLIKRRKNITHLRYLAFLKRLTSLSLQVLHNGALGCLSIVKNAMQLNSTLDILLDTENKVGSGKFDPNIIEPEFSNANCTSFFELALLMRHYHPTVVKMAQHISQGCQIGNSPFEPAVAKLSPIELFEHFESEQMAFNPPIPIPTPIKDIKLKKVKGMHAYKLKDVADMLSQKIEFKRAENDRFAFDFYSELC